MRDLRETLPSIRTQHAFPITAVNHAGAETLHTHCSTSAFAESDPIGGLHCRPPTTKFVSVLSCEATCIEMKYIS